MKKVFHFLVFFVILLIFALVIHEAGKIFFDGETKNQSVLIQIYDHGFFPATLSIPLGTEIVFINMGKENHYPASDSHPSHTFYDGTSIHEHCTDGATPAFDACAPIVPGKSWSFVFQKVGTLRYHDHLWPHLVGEIIVGGLETTLESGRVEAEEYKKLTEEFVAQSLQSNPRDAINALREKSLEDNAVYALCHDILHEIGRVSYKHYGTLEEAVRFQTDFCNSGYLHGLFESSLQAGSISFSEISKLCTSYTKEKGRQFDEWQCTHGVGHGLMYYSGGNLDESIQLCDDVFGQERATICHNGVFMEIFNAEIIGHEKQFVDPQNPFYTCSSRSIAKSECYFYVPTYLSQRGKIGFQNIFSECQKAERGYEHVCVQGVGAEAIKRNIHNPERVFHLCDSAGSFSNQEACVRGMLVLYMSQMGSANAGKMLCENAPKKHQETCFQATHGKEKFFGE